MIQRIFQSFKRLIQPVTSPVTTPVRSIPIQSRESIRWAVLQEASLEQARQFHKVWGLYKRGAVSKEEMEQARDAYIQSRRALPTLQTGKHLGHREAYKATR
jgi:hypothetical protein